ncbi:hypothetical protein [Seonamhaeicola sp.]|uniref:hypothetical protein n=1 Tax=Seonamhaeicola sp. TaxID=1912245 RepID=UPI00261023AC|nr:hypothetical protein [Seonamhaeicola sp.]
MRKLFFVLISISLISISSCDDGDIIDFSFDFDDEFLACEGVSDLVLYKTKNDPSESLSVLISSFTIAELLAVGDNDQLEINDKPATFYYRTYSDESISGLFCEDIPVDVNITLDEQSNCDLDISTILTEDDNDGVPTALESTNGLNPIGDEDNDGVLNYLDDNSNDESIGNVNGSIEDGFDTDNDGIPNYKDLDDDGDNVPTKDEAPDPNDDGDLSDAQDTDGNGVPDYLDKDDDGDGVDTRDEENASQDKNPTNDVTFEADGPDYLNPNVATSVPATEYRTHTVSKTYLVTVIVKDFKIEGLQQTSLDFGILDNSATSESETLETIFN